jgi:hypothetical protein
MAPVRRGNPTPTLVLQAGAHPIGIRPEGNALFDRTGADFIDTRRRGFGSLHVLPDNLIVSILSDLGARDLAQLARVSKALYCWSHHDEFWKHLVIEDMNARFQWHGSTWRQTYAYNSTMVDGEGKPNGRADIRVRGFYSDLLFQSWFCASLAFAPAWLEGNSIDRRNGLSRHDFIEQYERPGVPVILTDIVPTWPATTEWTREALCDRYGDVMVRAEAMDTTLANYFSYADGVVEESPLYLFDKNFVDTCKGMGDAYSVPPYFDEDFFGLLGADRPDYRWLIIGPARSGSSFHKDPNATSAWNATISGRKKWIMYPPDCLPPGVFPNDDGSEVHSHCCVCDGR